MFRIRHGTKWMNVMFRGTRASKIASLIWVDSPQ